MQDYRGQVRLEPLAASAVQDVWQLADALLVAIHSDLSEVHLAGPLEQNHVMHMHARLSVLVLVPVPTCLLCSGVH